MLFIERTDDGVTAKVDLDFECAITIVGNKLSHAPRCNVDVFTQPLDVPPSVGEAHLVTVDVFGLILQVERAGLDLVPYILRELSESLVSAVVALKGKTVSATPADNAFTSILPEHDF